MSAGMSPPPGPPPMQPMMPQPMMQSPDAGRIRTGLIVAGIGLILGAFIGFVGFNFVTTLIVFIGTLVAFTGTKSYPNARGTAMAGMGLILVGFIVGVVGFFLTPAIITSGSPALTDLQAILNAYATSLLLGFLGAVLTWIGVIVFPLRLITGSAKGLAIAGAVMGLLAAIILVALVYTAVVGLVNAIASGTITDPAEAIGALIVILLGIALAALVGLIGGILAVVGYIMGRKRLVPSGTQMPTM